MPLTRTQIDAARRGLDALDADLIDEALAGRVGRRTLMRHGTLLGLSLPWLGVLAGSLGMAMPMPARAAGTPGGRIRVALTVPAAAIDPVTIADDGGLILGMDVQAAPERQVPERRHHEGRGRDRQHRPAVRPEERSEARPGAGAQRGQERGRWVFGQQAGGEHAVKTADETGELREAEVGQAVQLAHPVAGILAQPVAVADQLAQRFGDLVGQVGGAERFSKARRGRPWASMLSVSVRCTAASWTGRATKG